MWDGDEMLEAFLKNMRANIDRDGEVYPRSEMIEDRLDFEGLDENPDGSFTVILG